MRLNIIETIINNIAKTLYLDVCIHLKEILEKLFLRPSKPGPPLKRIRIAFSNLFDRAVTLFGRIWGKFYSHDTNVSSRRERSRSACICADLTGRMCITSVNRSTLKISSPNIR